MAIYTNELEEAFLELREANTKYSIRVLELEKELQATREQLDYLMNPYSSPEEVMRRRFEVYDYLIAKNKQKDEVNK